MECSGEMDEIKIIPVSESIDYVRHELHIDPEPVTGDLVQFLYDVPYFSACGVFLSRQIFNQKMAQGGGDRSVIINKTAMLKLPLLSFCANFCTPLFHKTPSAVPAGEQNVSREYDTNNRN